MIYHPPQHWQELDCNHDSENVYRGFIFPIFIEKNEKESKRTRETLPSYSLTDETYVLLADKG